MAAKRAPKGLGYFQTLPSGKVRHVREGLTGPACRTKKEAVVAWKAKQLESHKSPETVAEFAEMLLDGPLKSELKPKTLSLYSTLICSVLPYTSLGKMRMVDVNKRHVEAFRDGLVKAKYQPRQEGPPVLYSASTVGRYMQCLSAILKRGGKSFPVKLPKVPETDKRVLTKEEATRLLALLKKHGDRVYAFGLLCLHGLRPHEAGLITSKHFDEDGFRVPAATKTGFRWVPMNDELREWMQGREGLVIPTEEGTVNIRNLRERQWRPAVEGTEFHGLKPYDLRSTAGTLMLQAGVDIRTAAEIMGHSPEMLARVYARSRNSVKVDAIRKVWG